MQKILSELVPVVIHTFVVYVFLIAALSLLGRRQTSQLGILELVIIMVLGSAVETAMVAGDTTLLAGLTSATTLLLCNRALSALLGRWPRVRRFLVGRPVPLVYNGKLLPVRVREAGLTEADVLEGVRERGYEDLDQVKFAVLEIGGAISVVPRDWSANGGRESG